MPELPEVETVRRGLAELVVGQRISSVIVKLPKLLRGYPPVQFAKRLVGRRFTGVGRRAKILILDLDSGDSLLVHLKMSGQLICVPADIPQAKHTHLVFELDGHFELRFVDTRQFGYLRLIEDSRKNMASEFADFGPEPLAPEFTEETFAGIIKSKVGSGRPIKAILLDQTFIAGIGNLYADEILYSARVHPERLVGSLSPKEIGALYGSLRQILARAIELHGTSFDLYVDARGRQGDYLKELMVYARSGQPCQRCGQTINKKKVSGRGSHFCPNCQKQESR